MNKKNILLTVIVSLVFVVSSCRRSDAVLPEEEPKEEPIDRNEPPPPGGCNTGGVSSERMFSSPYEDPIWHPNGKIIGFNQIPLKEIKYHKGYACPFHATYVDQVDSIGFWLVNADGTNKRRILPYQLTTPVWSPDGKWIAFSRESEIYKMPFDGEKFNTSAMVRLTNSGRNFFPVWSPDGEWIAYSHTLCNEIKCGIWIINKAGMYNEFVIPYGQYPAWRNDNEIVYLKTKADNNGALLGDSLWIYNITENSHGAIQFLTQSNNSNRYMKSSFDYSKLGFISQSNITGAEEKVQLYTIGTTGTLLTKMTNDGAMKFSWGPGNKIVYVSFNWDRIDETKGTLWTMNADGTDKKPLTYNSMKLTR